MTKNVTAFEASSPEELQSSLTEFLKDSRKKPRAAVLSVDDPKVIVRRFQPENVPLKDLAHHLLTEAVELMSLPSDEIVLDFQVTKSDGSTLKGIYVCMPKSLLEEYLQVFDRQKINLMKITERFLVSIDLLFQNDKFNDQRICFLDFSTENTINLFISSRHECELLRKVHYENFEEARKEILQSLRSASAKSRSKQYDLIYYHGSFERMDELMAALKKSFNARIKELVELDRKAALVHEKQYFSLNLLRNYMFSPAQLKYIQAGLGIALVLCVFNLAVLSFQITKKDKMINKIKSAGHEMFK